MYLTLIAESWERLAELVTNACNQGAVLIGGPSTYEIPGTGGKKPPPVRQFAQTVDTTG